MDMLPFIEIVLAMAGVFGGCVVASTIKHHMDSDAIKSQTSLGIQSIVAIATIAITGSMAEEAVELHAVPTPNLTPQTATAKATP